MSKQGIMPSQTTVEALRDFAFAYYSEHEGPSESEHIARDLAQALDGDLSRAAQAAPDPIWNCRCGHCESWADHGGGMGWCSEHNSMTVSGHICKRARPKAEYAEPAGGAEAPIPEPPAPEGECPHLVSGWECRHIHVLGVAERPRLCPWAQERLDWRMNCGLRALAADRAKLERECAGLKERCAAFGCDALRELRERAEQAEAELTKVRRTLQIPAWMPISERVIEVRVGHRNAEARAQAAEDSLAEAQSRINDLENLLENAEASALAAEKRAEGCFRLPKGKWQEPHFPFDGWRSYLRAVAETIERQWQRPDLNPREQSRPMRELLDAIERGPEGEGWWVSRETAEAIREEWNANMGSMGRGAFEETLRQLGIPAEWLAPAIADMPQREGKL